MTRARTRLLVVVAAFVCVVVIGTLGFLALDQQSAIECTLEWGRLAPFPTSAEQFSITTEGNMFTRGFHASFTARPAEIEQWLQQSPGTREVSPTIPATGIRHFQIAPGGGAQRAEVTVDGTTNRVSIYVSWS